MIRDPPKAKLVINSVTSTINHELCEPESASQSSQLSSKAAAMIGTETTSRPKPRGATLRNIVVELVWVKRNIISTENCPMNHHQCTKAQSHCASLLCTPHQKLINEAFCAALNTSCVRPSPQDSLLVGLNDDQEKCLGRLDAARAAATNWRDIRRAQGGGFRSYEAALFYACLEHPEFARMTLTQRRRFARVMLRQVPAGTQYGLPFAEPDDPDERIGGVAFYKSIIHYQSGQRIYPKSAKAFPIPLNNHNERMSHRAFNKRLDAIFEAVLRLRDAG